MEQETLQETAEKEVPRNIGDVPIKRDKTGGLRWLITTFQSYPLVSVDSQFQRD